MARRIWGHVPELLKSPYQPELSQMTETGFMETEQMLAMMVSWDVGNANLSQVLAITIINIVPVTCIVLQG